VEPIKLVDIQRVTLQKRYPLTISRGTQATSDNLFVFVQRHPNGPIGIGELAPATSSEQDADRGEQQLCHFMAEIPPTNPYDNYTAMCDHRIDAPAMAALDVAIWDLLAKEANLPLYALLGLPKRSVTTSVTAGLNPPEVTKERVPDILTRTEAKSLKIKLGSPHGLEYDKAHFEACLEAAAPFKVALRVDANGGWSVESALHMMSWLKDRGVTYVEQPLRQGMEADLPTLRQAHILPVFVDESVRTSSDVAKLARSVDGVNLKLMKSGGITEALRIVATARAHGLQTMIGCMSESSVAIAAGAAMGALFDHIDLDSHLNLLPDPAYGAPIIDGMITPTDAPGHGAGLFSMESVSP
jgi:muconate cycloisomerase